MKTKILLLALFWCAFSWGQFNINAGSTNYTQDFNTLTPAGAWANNTTLTGWYARTTNTASITTFALNTGTTTTAGLYSYGVAGTNPISERALGYATTNTYTGTAGTGQNFLGWRLKNNTGNEITSITITYTGEQWRRDNTVAQSMTVDYQTGATVTDLIAGTWTSISALTFTTLNNTGAASLLDGNAPANRVANITTTITVNIPAGEEIMIRWKDLNDSGNDHQLAIDDVTVNASISASPSAVTLADNPPQVAGANVFQGTANHILSAFQATVANVSATLTAATFTSSGNYQAADILSNGFKLWYSTTNNFSTATQIGTGITSTAGGTGETIAFSALSQSIAVGTGYFWVTASISPTATFGRTININSFSSGDLIFLSGTKSGSVTAAGTQTISVSPPIVPGSITKGCTTNTTQVLNWSAPASGSFDGYLLVVREAAVPNAVTSIVASTQPFNLNYTAAPTYNATTSRVLYIGNATTATITGLIQGISYTFALYSFKNNGASTIYSLTATTTTQVMGIPIVTNALTNAENAAASLTWTNPTTACYDQVLVVVTAAPGITFIPSGNSNTAYTPNTVFTGFNQPIYYSSGNFTTLSGLINGTTYYLEIFVRNGSEWSSGVEVSVTPVNSTPTVLKTGDLVLIAYDNDSGGGDDSLRLLTMVDINQGTHFLWANATYETGGLPAANVRTNKWFTCTTTPNGNVPFLEFNYTGAAIIPAGSVFCITTRVSSTASTISAVSPTGTSFTSFTITGKSADGSPLLLNHSNVNVSTGDPDSMFLLQGNFIYDVTGSTFVGTVLSGVQDGGLWYDLADNLSTATGDGLRRSRKHPSLLCASFQANSIPSIYRVSYDISLPGNISGTRTYLLGQILNYSFNWINSSFGVCPTVSPFIISSSDTFNRWTGGLNTNWFDCNNWAQLTVPDEFTDVVIFSTAAREAVIDFTAPFSDGFSDIAKCRNLTISGRKVQLEGNPNNKLEVHGNLLINSTGVLDMDDSNNATADGNLYLYKNFTNSLATSNFLEGNGTVSFTGSLPQIINNNVALNAEEFYNVVLNNDFNTAISNNLMATGDLEVKDNKFLTIGSANYVRVNQKLTNNGEILIENNGQFIQVNEVDINVSSSNNNFKVKRNTFVRNLDYVYWSAPVDGFAVVNLPNNLRFYWDPIATNANGTQGNWLAASGFMQKGQGYIARISNSAIGAAATPLVTTLTFQGSNPFNGEFDYTIKRGSTPGINDCWNLVGNPYPSAIDADLFLTDNTAIEGSVRIWTHGSLPALIASPFYQNFQYNYNPNDYIIYNGTATSIPGIFNGQIASGQGFFVRMLEEGETDLSPPTSDIIPLSSTITFKNAFRRATDNSVLDNSTFFRTATASQANPKSRIWLDLISPNNQMSKTVIGYVPGATVLKDRLYDALIKPTSFTFYSLCNAQQLAIQGRPVPFDTNDQVPLGMFIQVAGNYTIAISSADGIFEDQAQHIYLEDKVLNVFHDLRAAPYSFSVSAGTINDRFVLRYNTTTLTLTDTVYQNTVTVFAKNGIVNLQSSMENIQSVVFYDMLGRQIVFKEGINSITTSIPADVTNQTIIAKITLANGIEIVKKVLL